MDEYHEVEEVEEEEEEEDDGGGDVSLTQLLTSAQSGRPQVRDFSISSPESEVCNTFQCLSSSFDVVDILKSFSHFQEPAVCTVSTLNKLSGTQYIIEPPSFCHRPFLLFLLHLLHL